MADHLPPPPPLDSLLADGPVALFLDFDGTLVGIAPTPDEIDVPADLVDRLHALCDRLGGRLALVTGRALGDLEGHLPAIRICRAGSHGASRLFADGSRLGREPEGLPADATDRLARYAEHEGLLFERKEHGGALHFRKSPDQGEAAIRFARTLAEECDLDMFTGKGIVELVRPGANKGEAVRVFMDEAPFADARPIFIGDDLTDEDGMEAATKLGGFGVVAGSRDCEVARHRLDDVDAVHEWLGL